MTDHYAVLGVSPDAEDVVIKAAYRALSQRYHPDRCPPHEQAAATKRMAQINEAYSLLSDPQRRAAYDAERRSSRGQPEGWHEQSRGSGSQGGSSTPIAAKRAALVFAGTVAVLWFGVERKSLWTFAWDWAASGFTDASHYHIHWFSILVVVAVVAKLWPRRS